MDDEYFQQIASIHSRINDIIFRIKKIEHTLKNCPKPKIKPEGN